MSQPGGAVLVLLGLAAVVALSVNLYVLGLQDTARDLALPAEERLTAARRAGTLAPWSAEADVTLSIVEAERLLADGNVNEAYFLLLPLAQTVRGDALFRSTYRTAVAAKWTLDSRKAHVQHGREEEDGSLDPEDVEK